MIEIRKYNIITGKHEIFIPAESQLCIEKQSNTTVEDIATSLNKKTINYYYWSVRVFESVDGELI